MHEFALPKSIERISDSIWQQSPATTFRGSLEELQTLVPTFRREPFRVSDTSFQTCNARMDAIIRLPDQMFNEPIPVGTVSKTYSLIQHQEVIDAALKAMKQNHVQVRDLMAELTISEYGERMALRMQLPPSLHLGLKDGHPLALQLRCLNSVDGSTSFHVWLDWFRLVCRNGMKVGVSQRQTRLRHIQELAIDQIAWELETGLGIAQEERQLIRDWENHPVQAEIVAGWVNEEVRKTWGFKAAARAFCIASHGVDCEIGGSYAKSQPSTIEVKHTVRVPGAPTQVGNVYDLSQTLSWVASHRNDVDEAQAWIGSIPDLMQAYLKREHAPH